MVKAEYMPSGSNWSWVSTDQLYPTEDPTLRPDPSDPTGRNQLGLKPEKVQAIAQRIQQGGYLPPIKAAPDGGIEDGHHRWHAAQELGLDRVAVSGSNHPLRIPDEDEDVVKAEMNSLLAAAKLLLALRALRKTNPAPPRIKTWAMQTHGDDKAHLHDATCKSPACEGYPHCAWHADVQNGGSLRNYTHLLPKDVSGYGYQLWLAHSPQEPDKDYEHIHASLVGPGLMNKPVTREAGAWGKAGYGNVQRYMPEIKAGNNWPSGQAWSASNVRLFPPAAARTRQDREMKALIERAQPAVEQATRHMIISRGESIAGDDPERFYAHAPSMLRHFRKKR